MLSRPQFIKVEGLSKSFLLDHSIISMLKIYLGKQADHLTQVLSDISFKLNEGDTLGIVGPNGAGKSTLLKLITNNMTPTNGTIEVSGSIGSILELGSTFQLELNAVQNLNIFRTSIGAAGANIETDEKILEFAELEEYSHRPLREFSTGMIARLAFAAASSFDPDILIIDEALSVGDIRFQQKSSKRIDEFKQRGKIIVFVSHDMQQVRRFCNKVLWLDKGKVRFLGDVKAGTEAYLNSIWKQNSDSSAADLNEAVLNSKQTKRTPNRPGVDQIPKLINEPSIKKTLISSPDSASPNPISGSADTSFPMKIRRLEVNGSEIKEAQVVRADFDSYLNVSIDCIVMSDLHETTMSFYLKDKLGTLVAGGGTQAWGLARDFSLKTDLILDFNWKLDLQPDVYNLEWFVEFPSLGDKSVTLKNRELFQVEILAPDFDVWAIQFKPQFQE